jgi:hypothetical protein
MKEMQSVCRILVGKAEERDFFGDLDVDGKVVLKCILNRLCGCGLNSSSEKMDLGWVLANSYEPLESIKDGEVFLIS